jgi:hypothetical protein
LVVREDANSIPLAEHGIERAGSPAQFEPTGKGTHEARVRFPVEPTAQTRMKSLVNKQPAVVSAASAFKNRNNDGGCS